MRLLAAVITCSVVGASFAYAQGAAPQPDTRALQAVSLALERYERETVFGNLWRRPDLSPRDRSIVTISALITRNQTAELPRYIGLAIDNGVTPGTLVATYRFVNPIIAVLLGCFRRSAEGNNIAQRNPFRRLDHRLACFRYSRRQ